jgi:SAM-dependent methyltransferase
MLTYIVRQFAKPTGPAGALAGLIMATRPSNRKRNAWGVSLLDVRRAARVLEIGCGPGLALDAMCRSTPAAWIVGVDHSALMVANARHRIERHIASGRADVLEADVAHLPFQKMDFDRILTVNAFAFWRATPGAIERVLALLKPGGRLVIVHQPRGRDATDEACRTFARAATAALESAGFTNIRTEFLALSPIAAGIIAERPA